MAAVGMAALLSGTLRCGWQDAAGRMGPPQGHVARTPARTTELSSNCRGVACCTGVPSCPCSHVRGPDLGSMQSANDTYFSISAVGGQHWVSPNGVGWGGSFWWYCALAALFGGGGCAVVEYGGDGLRARDTWTVGHQVRHQSTAEAMPFWLCTGTSFKDLTRVLTYTHYCSSLCVL